MPYAVKKPVNLLLHGLTRCLLMAIGTVLGTESLNIHIKIKTSPKSVFYSKSILNPEVMFRRGPPNIQASTLHQQKFNKLPVGGVVQETAQETLGWPHTKQGTQQDLVPHLIQIKM